MDGVFQSSYITTLRGMLTATESIIRDWNSSKENWERTKEILVQKKMVLIYSKLEDILNTIYYWSVIDTSNLMIIELSKIVEIIDRFSLLFYLFDMVVCVVGLNLYFSKIDSILERYYSIFGMIPLALVKENMVFMGFLKDIRKKHNLFGVEKKLD